MAPRKDVTSSQQSCRTGHTSPDLETNEQQIAFTICRCKGSVGKEAGWWAQVELHTSPDTKTQVVAPTCRGETL